MTLQELAGAQAYALRLRSSREQMADEQLRAVIEIVPELAGREVASFAHAAAVANLELMAGVLERGSLSDLATPLAVGALVRHLAWGGVEMDMLARAYRIGQDWLYEDIRSFCQDLRTTPDEAVALLGELGQAALRFSDLSTTLVIEQYKREREDLSRNAYAKRASEVRSLLEGAAIDLPELERKLGYGFGGPHTAVRISSAGQARTEGSIVLRQAASDLIGELGDPPALVIEDHPGRLMIWVRAPIDPRRLRGPGARLDTASTNLGIGRVEYGPAGFRRTSQQADRASAVGPRDGEAIVTYAEVSLVALMLENPEGARSFMVEELGGLADDNGLSETLRSTLRAFLAHQCRVVPTARATFLHRNTITERVRRVETVLGRAVADRAAELDAALRLHDHFSRLSPQAAGAAT